jgi:hypothetical protein
MDILVVKVLPEGRVANPERGREEARAVLHERVVVQKVVLRKGQGADPVQLAQMLRLKGLGHRAKRGVPTLGRPEVRLQAKPLIRTGNRLRVQRVAHVAHEIRAVQVVVRAGRQGVRAHHRAVADRVSRQVVERRRGPATVATQTAQPNHARPLAEMTGSPKVQQHMSRGSVLQSRRGAIVKRRLSLWAHSTVKPVVSGDLTAVKSFLRHHSACADT